MLYEFSLPTKADKVPTGPDWLHEVKYDGYRMMLIREQDRVQLISQGWALPLSMCKSNLSRLPRRIDGIFARAYVR